MDVAGYILLGFVIGLGLLVIWLVFLRKKETAYRAKFPSFYYCVDGDKVRSLSEVVIDDCLTRNNVKHVYEGIIEEGARKFKYDWFLPDSNTYVEFFGYSGKKYAETRKEKES